MFSVAVLRAVDLLADSGGDAKFLGKLPRQSLGSGLAQLHFSAGELPFEREAVRAAALADQYLPILLDERGGDSDHAAGGSQASKPAAPVSICKMRYKARAPSISGGPGVFRMASRTT